MNGIFIPLTAEKRNAVHCVSTANNKKLNVQIEISYALPWENTHLITECIKPISLIRYLKKKTEKNKNKLDRQQAAATRGKWVYF